MCGEQASTIPWFLVAFKPILVLILNQYQFRCEIESGADLYCRLEPIFRQNSCWSLAVIWAQVTAPDGAHYVTSAGSNVALHVRWGGRLNGR